MDIGDGDLVRLARDGDRAAFRLLVERHLPMARARAARLCPQPEDADDAVQDAFLQAFIALDRLRDPGRFAGWLGGIVANICRAQRRRAPLTLLGDWPENLHPASAGNLPSAEDLDRADALGRAVAGLPPGQRQAVTQYYYADQPAGQAVGMPGAAKASLHKARRRLREYMAFTDGLDHWQLRGTFLSQGTGSDYSATTEDGRAILAAAVPEPAGSALLAQEIEPGDYRGGTVTFRAELRTAEADGRAGLALRAASLGRSMPPQAASPDPREDPGVHLASATGTGAWAQYEVTAQVPADASLIRFGVFLNGGGQVELRHPALALHPPGQQ